MMDILILFVVSIMWSFVGILVKTAGTMVNSSIISFCRFFFGVIFLGIFIYVRDRKVTLLWKEKWIWIGVLGKSGNYIFENIGLAMGASYGNILAVPFQTIIALLISIKLFKEKIDRRHLLGIMLCLPGILLVSWNGVPLRVFLENNFFITLLFIISAMGVVMHTLSQKMLIKNNESGVMNLSVFVWCTMLTSLPAGINGKWTGTIMPAAVLALIALGFITGISFFLYSRALKRVPLMFAVIISNSSMLLNILWGRLFFKENVSVYIVTGGIAFVLGVILLNLPASFTLKRKAS